MLLYHDSFLAPKGALYPNPIPTHLLHHSVTSIWDFYHLSFSHKMASQVLGFDSAGKGVDRWILLHIVKGQMFQETLHLAKDMVRNGFHQG